MRQFADLYAALDESTKTNDKVAAMALYFASTPPEDAAWAMSFLTGRRPKRQINSTKMATWASEAAGVPGWMFGECYDAVGDLAETMALIFPTSRAAEDEPERPLHDWVENTILQLGTMTEDEQRVAMIDAWQALDFRERFLFNKLITGAFRVGVSQELVLRALAKASGVPVATLAHRLMGTWSPTPEFFATLLGEDDGQSSASHPYPFCLAHPLESDPAALGDIKEWHAEWKWDGIRAQLIRRQGQSFIWSRGEDLMTERFPEIAAICDALPEGTVIDGEILAWASDKPMKFQELQKRIGRKNPSKKILTDVPVALVTFDVIEWGGADIREKPFSERRAILESLLVMPPFCLDDSPRLILAEPAQGASWEALAEERQRSRDLNVEGLMLKRLDSPYVVGRKRGLWWKWKIEPFTVDAILIYAQRGSGKRASLYSDYTFGVWNAEGVLVPFAKAYSGLTDEEIRRVDSFVRRNTQEKFGPVRTVSPELVFELAFEGIQLSSRHKSGVAVRFPRIARWRHDKKPADADTLAGIKEILLSQG